MAVARFFRHATPDRAPTASNVGSRSEHGPPSPTPLIPFRGSHSLGKAGILTGPWGLHVLLRLLRICSFLHWVPRGDGSQEQAETGRLRPKQTGGQNTDRHLQRAELMREIRFPFSDFGENHDHRDPARVFVTAAT